MCNNNDTNNNENCILDILKVILLLQQSVCQNDTCLQSCDRGYLGQNCTTFCNTRPIVLYTCSGNGTPWTMPTTKEDVICGTEGAVCSSVFRIEKLDENCATFRVLAPNPDTTEVATIPYVATNSFFTMNLNCVCALRCLNDTFIECI